MAHQVHDVVAPLADEWDGLADRLSATPFVRPGWIDPWWRAFGSGELEILTVRRAGRLAGVLPLQRRRGRLESPTNWHSPLFDALAEDDDVAADLARALFAQRPSSVRLAFLDQEGVVLAALRRAAHAAHYRVLERIQVRSPFLRIEGDWAAYEQGLSKNVRGDVRRRRRRLEEAGSLSSHVEDGAIDLERLLAEGFAVEGSGWKEQRGTAIASDERVRDFYVEVARAAAARGALRLAFLRLDGKAVAFLFDLEDAGAHYYLKGGYHPDFSQFSPTKVLLHMMLERAFALGLERFEFLGGEDRYKLDLANGMRELWLFQAFAPSLLGTAERLFYAYGRPVAKRTLSAFHR